VRLWNTLAACAGLLSIAAARSALRAQEPTATETRSVWDGVYTEEQAKRGEALYQKECKGCHGVALAGGESSPPLTGGACLSNWNGLTLGDLFERIRKTMPQNTPGRLNRQQNADLLAFVLSANKFPGGKMELSRQTEFLKEIRFEAVRPDQRK
jgi:mono/diheme cytochrome c family protein